jgi:hypothetical protein
MRKRNVVFACCAVLGLGLVAAYWKLGGGPSGLFEGIGAVLSWLDNKLGPGDVTTWSVGFVSTLPERIILFVLCSLVLGVAFYFGRRLSSSVLRLLAPALATLVVFLGIYRLFENDFRIIATIVVALFAGLIHLAFCMRAGREGGGPVGIGALLIEVIPVCALGFMLLDGWALVDFSQALHHDQFVRQFASMDLNGLELDLEQRLVFANGHGTNHLLAYDMDALDRPPRESQAELGWAQGMFYNRPDRELYIFNPEKHSLLVLDPKTLAVTKSLSGLNLSEGDCFIAMDSRKDRIIIASEAGYPARRPSDDDGPEASPIVVLQRTAGKQISAVRDCGGFCNPGHIVLSEKQALLYMGFMDGIVAYDVEAATVRARTRERYRSIGDHLALTPDENEVLFPYPMHSAIFRFDARTLEFKGTIPTVFGVRNVAVDPTRNLLLTVSGFNNKLDVIDLQSRKRLAQYYIAPWLRSIALDAKTGVAYVSSVGGLYRVNYIARLPGGGIAKVNAPSARAPEQLSSHELFALAATGALY